MFLGRTLLLRLQGYQTCVGAGMLAPGVANAVLVQHFVLGVFGALSVHFGSLLEKHLFLGRTLLLRLQGYQTCAGAGMRASGIANAVLAQHFVLGMLAHLFADFGGLLEKHLFLGRTLLLRLQGYQTCAGAGMLASGLANAVLAQQFVLAMFAHLFADFGGLLEKRLFLGRTLLLRLQGYQTCVGAGMLASGLANAMLAQHFVLASWLVGWLVGWMAGWLVGW
jgi:hypothetical protein